MRHLRGRSGNRLNRLWAAVAGVLVSNCLLGHVAAQSCTSQAKMTNQQRDEIGQAAFALAEAVETGDAAKVRAGSVAHYAGDVNQTAYLVTSTGERIRGDQLAVTQLYLLDATASSGGNGIPAEFSCPLSGTASETDFDIPGLPRGRFAFAMVEARGAHPWLLAFLLEQEDGAWKMAGFYPHPRTAAGHDGLWYWTAARQDVKASKPWLAWVQYGEADQLLRPAAFVSSGNLDKLRAEQHAAAPQALAAGIGTQTPLSVQGPGGAVYRVTELGVESAPGATMLNLTIHLEVTGPALGEEAATERNVAAARALLLAHPELREGFSDVWVVADGAGGAPFVVERPIQELMAGKATR